MKIRTVGELQTRVDEELGWRKKEITAIVTSLQGNVGALHNPLLRALVPLLYAHWEGFVKNSCYYYLSFISTQRVSWDVLIPSLAGLQMARVIDEGAASTTSKSRATVVEAIRDNYGNRRFSAARTDAATKSNLSFKRFKNILHLTGVDDIWYDKYEDMIDVQLVELRNKIAHGEWVPIDLNSFVDIRDEVFSIMDRYKTDIVNAALMGDYKI